MLSFWPTTNKNSHYDWSYVIELRIKPFLRNCVNLGFSKHSTVVYFALLAGSGEDLGSPIDDNDDGDLTEHHHKKRQHPG